VSRGADLLEFSEGDLWLLGWIPTTGIANNTLDCSVSFSVEVTQFVEYGRCHCDGSARSILESIYSEVGDAGFDLPCISSRVHVEPQLAAGRLQPRRALARPSAFVSSVRPEKHKSPHKGRCENRMVRGMPLPCQLLISSNPTKRIRSGRVIEADYIRGDHQ